MVMKIKVLFICLVCIPLLISSCKKDKEEETKLPVYAGITNDEMQHQQIDPPLQVHISYFSEDHFYYGIDSLDIDQNGKFDFLIKIGYFDDYRDVSSILYYPSTEFVVTDSIQFTTNLEYYPMGLGAFGQIYWVDTLSYNTRIDDMEKWYPQDKQYLWVVPKAVIWGSNGPWFSLENSEKYIGLRMKKGDSYKYGWIKVKVITRTQLEFQAFAIQK